METHEFIKNIIPAPEVINLTSEDIFKISEDLFWTILLNFWGLKFTIIGGTI